MMMMFEERSAVESTIVLHVSDYTSAFTQFRLCGGSKVCWQPQTLKPIETLYNPNLPAKTG